MNAVSLKKVDVSEKKVDLGGGCFWCTEAIFQRLKGVIKVESGYSGGKITNPTYREVCSGITGRAEMVEVTYNPNEISFDDLLRIHLSTHNPTAVDQQGADQGSQYRSIIFYRTEDEKQTAMKVIHEVQKSYLDMVVTQLEMFEHFYKAEDYHQDYYNKNPDGGYCQAVIDPKLSKFRELYNDNIK